MTCDNSPGLALDFLGIPLTQYYYDVVKKLGEENAAIDNMIREVRYWIQPSIDHAPLKAQMLEQLILSKTDLLYYCEAIIRLHDKNPENIYKEDLTNARKDVERYASEVAVWQENNRKNRVWIDQLSASLGSPDPPED